MKAVAFVAAAIAIAAPMVDAQETPADRRLDRFQLFTKCDPVFPKVSVERSSPYVENLEDADLEEVIHTGLRNAGLLGEEEVPPFLYVTVGILHWAYVARVELMKEVTDPLTQLRGAATTWREYRYGIHSGDPGFVISSLSNAFGTFLDEYLRVNDLYCSGQAGAAGAP
ncbi:MAG: hypothetical protein OXQ94_02540 [Gemmatimonadota bacterium]|nr:hypothetical protein [Gemmatimonadota bacterium]MDE2870558.1 hypothetical protein [Gemmatimonadota bacterium]